MTKATLGVFCGLFVLIGCGSKPIPLVAVAGTTVTIALPGDFEVGYGLRLNQTLNPIVETPTGAPYSANSTLEDPQRGELVFSLYTDEPTPQFRRHLQLAYVTRVNASPQSVAANQSTSVVESGQNLAFVNIPHEVSEGSYLIRVRRYRRAESSPYAYALDPSPLPQTTAGETYFGWGNETGSPLARGIPITIKDGDANYFTPMSGWADVGNPYYLAHTDVSEELDSLVPSPHFEIQVPSTEPGHVNDPRPAAWQISLAYQKNKIRIVGVELKRTGPSGAMVRWSADQTPVVSCSDSDIAFLSVKVVDPDLVTSGVRVAYELRNFGQACGGRASASTVPEWMDTFRAYDQDGEMITTSKLIAFP